VSLAVIVVDDEPLAREKIRTLLAEERDVEVVAECATGTEAIAAIERLEPDLVFLDVQMPEVDGFGVLEALDPERIPAVVFVTAYDRHALRAFDVHALDYLLKPFDRERFARALSRARATLEPGRSERELSRRLLSLLREVQRDRGHAERIVVRDAGRVFFLRVDEIDWIEAAGNYTCLHAGKDSHLLRETMKALEARLDPERFLRVHRSTIVRVERIREMRAGAHGEYEVVLADGTRLSSSRSYSRHIQRLLERGARPGKEAASS
jgi:two-component system LytT family response regulator